MKINNVEKFRKELYTALEDAYIWEYVEESSATWKGNADDYEETMKEENHYKVENGEPIRISLAQPIMIRSKGKSLYLTVDEQGVNFYRSTEKEFEYAGDIDAGLYLNRMSFVMSLVDRINYKLNK